MPKPISDPSQLRILIIEDNSDDAFLIANAIRKSYPDAEFLEAPGRSEFESVLASGQHLDIILSDWSLPQFSGMEALARIQTLGITVPFIIVSGKIGEEAAIAAIRQGAYDYVLKDNLGRLSNAISHALLLHESKEKARQDQMRITLQAKALQAASVAIALLDKDKTIEVVNPAFEKLTGYEESEVLGRNATEFCLDPDCLQHAELFADGNSEKDFSSTAVEQKKDGSLYFEERKVCPVTDQDGQINHFVLIKQNITAIEQAREEFALQVSYTAATRQARTPEALCNATISFIREQSEKVHAGICLYTDGTTACKKWYGENMQGIVPDQNNFLHEVNLTDEKIGVLALSFTSPLPYNLNKLFMITAGQFENYLNRLVIQQRTTAQIRHLSFLKLISRTISTVMDFDEVMKPLLVQTKATLDSDAVALYLFDGQRNSFVCRASEGFRYNLIKNAVIPLGQPNVGLAAEKQQMTIVSNFDNVDPRSQFGNLVEKEEFRSQYCVPIIIGGKSFGVLEIFQRKAFAASQEWLSLFDAIALQMGLALDYNNLYDKLQKAYLDLEDSYEATLEGWSAAMDSRDQETEGHAKRVASLSISLALRLGLSQEDTEHIRRGALLHDIGKIGVPDSILKKNGPLTDEEWVLMKEHPRTAYEFLHKIPYMEKSLEIPLYHHEKWDGTGYPQGLKGQDIPLAARLFSIIDVYDALTSDRPYRKAWSKESALAYIKEQSGTSFDPAIVQAFMAMIAQ